MHLVDMNTARENIHERVHEYSHGQRCKMYSLNRKRRTVNPSSMTVEQTITALMSVLCLQTTVTSGIWRSVPWQNG